MVELPDHMHAIWILPVGDDDFAKRWMLVRSGITPNSQRGRINKSRQTKGERSIWQRRYIVIFLVEMSQSNRFVRKKSTWRRCHSVMTFIYAHMSQIMLGNFEIFSAVKYRRLLLLN